MSHDDALLDWLADGLVAELLAEAAETPQKSEGVENAPP